MQLVWSRMAADAASPAPTAYVTQRWPTADIPNVGQDGYLDSLVSLDTHLDRSHGTFAATDSPLSDGEAQFYRVLALASSGQLIAASKAATPIPSKGEQVPDLRSARCNSCRCQLPPVCRRPICNETVNGTGPCLPSILRVNAGSVFVSRRACGGGPCRRLLQAPTIQAAIDAAAPGSTINVLPGAINASRGRQPIALCCRRSAVAAALTAAVVCCSRSALLQMARRTPARATLTSLLAARASSCWEWRARTPRYSHARDPPAPAASFPSPSPTATEWR